MKVLEWSPKEDITTFELAVVQPLLFSMFTKESVGHKANALFAEREVPEGEIRRHFKVISLTRRNHDEGDTEREDQSEQHD